MAPLCKQASVDPAGMDPVNVDPIMDPTMDPVFHTPVGTTTVSAPAQWVTRVRCSTGGPSTSYLKNHVI